LRALAGLLGVSSVTVWKWEKGDSKPRARLIAPLARALDVTPLRLQSPHKEGQMALATRELGESIEAIPSGRSAAAVRETDDSPGPEQAEGLADVIARAKQMIADASGTGSKNITIVIEY
jgi:transcriptional regulator with XRE-family HTH domain